MNLESKLTKNLTTHLKLITPKHWFSKVYHYSVLPPGKLFRPQLVHSIESDFQGKATFENDDHSFLASAIEIHHTYTLIHDDLPCMDDDDHRRNRPSAHKQFGEWQALLAGDGLLNGSYQLMARINSYPLLRYFSWCVGSIGLIQGQVLDLAEEMSDNFETLLETHKFKTARLIQASIVGSYILTKNPSMPIAKKLHRLGHHLGIVFQFLDDLSELTDEKISPHELNINPWIKFPKQSYSTLCHGLKSVEKTLKDLRLKNTYLVTSKYFNKMNSLIFDNLKMVKTHYVGETESIEASLIKLTSNYDCL